MAEALPIAIVGAGLMGRWHAQYARYCSGKVVGILDCDRDSAKRLAESFTGAQAYTELNDLLKACQPRVIHICTPIESHARIAETAMAFGANVLVEKPMAVDAAASRDLLAAAERNRLLLTPTHQFLFQRGFLLARKTAPSLGRILHLDATFCSAGGEIPGSDTLDGIAGGILPHPLALIERLLPGHLDAIVWSVTRTFEGEWRILGAGKSLSVSILISLHGRPTEASFRIVTDGGVFDVDLFHGFATVDTAAVSRLAKAARPFRMAARRFIGAGTNLARRVVTREFAYPGLRTLISEFYDAVRRGGPPPISPSETLAVAVARDVVLQSARRESRLGAL
jgi:predicted dehydrogenase